MLVPPPVSVIAYSTALKGENETNYLERRSLFHYRMVEQCGLGDDARSAISCLLAVADTGDE